MSEMHDGGVRRPERCPQLKDASCEADHFSMIFTADLERRPRFEGTAIAARENCPLELEGGGAEPAPARYNPQSLVVIHRKNSS